MYDKILTVVVPSYNAGGFLTKGIPSLLDKRILDDIEVLIVDDGSTDNTANIADILEQDYPGTVRAIHKENGGHGSTINTGISVGRGEYFCVVDADDSVDTDNFVKLVDHLKDGKADLYLANSVKVDSSGKKQGEECINGVDYDVIIDLPNCLNKIFDIEMHNYFIKTKILRNYGVKIHEHLFYVDNEFVLYSLLYVKTCIAYNMTVYRYLIGRDGQSISIASGRKNYQQFIDVLQYLMHFYEQNKSQMTDSQKEHYSKKIAYVMGGAYATLLSYRPSKNYQVKMIEFDNMVKRTCMDVYNSNRNISIDLLRRTSFKLYYLGAIFFRVLNKNKLPD